MLLDIFQKKTYKTFFFLIFFAFNFLLAEDNLDPFAAADLCSEESVIIGNCVNAITGDFIFQKNDLKAIGVESVLQNHIYSTRYKNHSSPGGMIFSPHLYVKCYNNTSFTIWDHSGIMLIYHKPRHKKKGYKKIKRHIKYDVILELNKDSFKGVSNAANLEDNTIFKIKNSEVKYNQKNGTLKIIGRDGSERHYLAWFDTIKKMLDQKHPNKKKKPFYLDFNELAPLVNESNFLLAKERLPNGNWICYDYDDYGVPKNIWTTNSRDSKQFSSISTNLTDNEIISRTSCRKVLKRKGSLTFCDKKIRYWNLKKKDWDNKNRGFLDRFELHSKQSPEHPDESYSYLNHHGKLIQDYNFPDNKNIHLDYYTLGKHEVNGDEININSVDDERFLRVKSIKIRTTKGKLKELFHFIYHPGKVGQSGGYTEVFDSSKNKIIFRYSPFLRLTAIEKYALNNGVYKKINMQTLHWGNENNETIFLLCRNYYDSNNEAIISKRYDYDGNGNVIKQTLYGNVSGECCTSLNIASNGYPIENGIEKFSKYKAFNGKNFVIKEWDDSGLAIHYTYHSNTNRVSSKLISQNGEIKRRFFYEYDIDNILIKEVTDNGISHDRNDLKKVTKRLIKVIYPLKIPPYGLTERIEYKYLDLETFEEKILSAEVFEYNNKRQIVKKQIFGAQGKLYDLFYTYDAKGKLISETNALSKKAIYEYDLNENKIFEKTFSQKEYFFDYDYNNRLIRKNIQDKEKICLEEYEYDLRNNKVLEKDKQSNVKRYEYDAFGNIVKETFPLVKDELGNKVEITNRYKYDDLSRLIEKLDPDLNLTKTSYNILNKPICIDYNDGTQERYIYNLDGTLKEHINQEGTRSLYTYDYKKRPINKEIYSVEGILLRSNKRKYDTFNIICETDIDSNYFTYTYDGAARKTKEEFFSRKGKLLSIKEWFYNDEGFVEKKIIGNDLIILYKRDLLGRIIKKTKKNRFGKKLFQIEYEYDDANNKSKIISFISNKKSIEKRKYDIFDRMIKSIDALNNTTTIYYNDFYLNELGQHVKQIINTNALNQKTIVTFDALSRETVQKKINPNNETISLEEKFYDTRNNLSRQVSTIYNPNKSTKKIVTYWKYNAMNRLEFLTEAFGNQDAKTTSYLYTDLGKLKKMIKPDHVEIIHEYDPIGNKTKVYSSRKDIDYEFIYNNLNMVIQAKDYVNNEITTREYDELGNIKKEMLANGLEIRSKYDLFKNKTNLKFLDSAYKGDESGEIDFKWASVDFIYDSLNLKKIIRKDQNNHMLYEHSFLDYDLNGNLLKEKRINDSIVDYTLDSLARTVCLNTHYHSQKTKFDEIGRISQIKWDGFLKSTSNYNYDDLNQVISEEGLFNNKYQFDSHNARLKKNNDFYEINDLNEIISTNESEFQYDENGNPLNQKIGFNEINYFYDSLDRLIKIEKPSYYTLEFKYDPFNRRLCKKVSLYSYIWGWYEEDFRYFLYDDQNEIGSFDKNLVKKDFRILSNTNQAEIGSSISIEIDNKVLTPIHDISGNIISLVNGDALLEHYRYSAFGERKIFSSSKWEQSTSQINNQWQFSSKRIDEESQLIYFGRRYYDPKLGRWLTPDPKGFIDGLNLYAFVNNDPLVNLDLYGLYAFNPVFFEEDRRYRQENIGQVINLNLPEKSLNKMVTFQNGICTSKNEALYHARYLSKMIGGHNISLVYNQDLRFLSDVIRAGSSIFFETQTKASKMLAQHWKTFLDQDKKNRIFHIAHSEGAVNTRNALRSLGNEYAKRIDILAIAPAAYISKEESRSVWHFRCRGDKFVPKIDRRGLKHNRDTSTRLIPNAQEIKDPHNFQNNVYRKDIEDSLNDFLREG